MKRLPSFALSLLLLATAGVHPAFAVEKEPRKILSGWVPYYSVKTVLPLVRKLPSAPPNVPGQPAKCDASQYGPVENEAIENSYLFKNKDLMKEVMPFWFSLKSPTVIRDDYVTGNPSWPMADTVCLMRRAELQIIPTMTDGTDKLVLAGYLANSSKRTTLVKTIVQLVMKNNFDGIDLDYEGFAFVDGNATWSKTAPHWVAFIKELSASLHANNKLLSVSTPYLYDPTEKQKGYFVYAWADIASSIDRLRIMTYDYSVAKPGPMGPISWTEKTIKYATSIMPASKVYMGLPGYGRDWITSVQGKCPKTAPPGQVAGAKAATFLIRDAEEKSIIRNVVPTFNEKFSEATYSYAVTYASQVDGSESTSCTVNRTVWYQNARSYAERFALVEKYGLGGAALWTLGMEGQPINNVIRDVATAMAPDPVVNTISFDGINQDAIYYGDLFTVTGLFTRKDLTPIAGLIVAVEMKRSNEDAWSTIAELTTASDGSISTPMILGGTASLRLTTAEIKGLAKSQSSELKILVKSKLQVDRPISAPKASSFVIKAQLLPRLAGKSAFLQKNVNGKWQNVGVASTSDANGVFTFTTSESKRGVATMRIQVVADLSSELFAIVIR